MLMCRGDYLDCKLAASSVLEYFSGKFPRMCVDFEPVWFGEIENSWRSEGNFPLFVLGFSTSEILVQFGQKILIKIFRKTCRIKIFFF